MHVTGYSGLLRTRTLFIHDAGVLDFEEFKKFARYANKNGKRRSSKTLSRQQEQWSKQEEERNKLRERRIREKAAAAARLAEENKARKQRLKEARAQGRTSAHLDEDTEEKRAKAKAQVTDGVCCLLMVFVALNDASPLHTIGIVA